MRGKGIDVVSQKEQPRAMYRDAARQVGVLARGAQRFGRRDGGFTDFEPPLRHGAHGSEQRAHPRKPRLSERASQLVALRKKHVGSSKVACFHVIRYESRKIEPRLIGVGGRGHGLPPQHVERSGPGAGNGGHSVEKAPPRPIGPRAPRFPGATPRRREAGARGLSRRFVGETGLSDAWLADERKRHRISAPHTVEGGGDRLELRVTAVQGRSHPRLIWSQAVGVCHSATTKVA